MEQNLGDYGLAAETTGQRLVDFSAVQNTYLSTFQSLGGLGIGFLAALLAVLPHLLARAAPLPWASLCGTLAAVLVLGLAAGGLGVRAVLRAPLLLSLREENL